MIRATDITSKNLTAFDQPIPVEDVTWVLKHWPELKHTKTRKLPQFAVSRINKVISNADKDHRAGYHDAKVAIIYYLHTNLGWELDKKQNKKMVDNHNQSFKKTQKFKQLTETLTETLSQHLTDTIDNDDTPSFGLSALTLLFDTAPFSLKQLHQILTPRCTESGEIEKSVDSNIPQNIELALDHDPIKPQRARVQLGALSAQIMKRYDYDKNEERGKHTDHTIKNAIVDVLKEAPFNMPVTYLNLRKILRCHWYTQLDQWGTDDLFNLENQSALTSLRYTDLLKGPRKFSNVEMASWHLYLPISNSINNQSTCEQGKDIKSDYQKYVDTQVKTLKSLFKSDGKGGAINHADTEPVNIDNDDVTPYFYFKYASDLIENGGDKLPTLEIATINSYLGFKRHLYNHPISLAECTDGYSLKAWAAGLYHSAVNETTALNIYRFLSRIRSVPLIDHLDISDLTPPLVKPKIDANLVVPFEYNQIQESLEQQSVYDPLKVLFSKVALALTYNGALRRGEILRLRIQDCEPKNVLGDIYRLKITKTKEGKPKNKKTRFVYLSLTEHDANLLKLLLQLKRDEDPEHPLIGYEYETINQRSIQYLLPITRAIKQICGSDVRFHHLRHSGALILLVQGIKLFNENCLLPQILRHDSKFFTKSMVNTRFSYWVEDRDIAGLNASMLFDQIGDMLGHMSFATTRKNYIHGHEYLHCLLNDRYVNTTKQQMRVLWSLPKSSNKLSPLITQIQKHGWSPCNDKEKVMPFIKPFNSAQLNHPRTGLNIDREALLVLSQTPSVRWSKFSKADIPKEQPKQSRHSTLQIVKKSIPEQSKTFAPQNVSDALPYQSQLDWLREIANKNPSPWTRCLSLKLDILQNNELTTSKNEQLEILNNLHRFFGHGFIKVNSLSQIQQKQLNHWLDNLFDPATMSFCIPANKRTAKTCSSLLQSSLFKLLKPKFTLSLNKESTNSTMFDSFLNIVGVSKSNIITNKHRNGPSKLILTFNCPSKISQQLLNQGAKKWTS